MAQVITLTEAKAVAGKLQDLGFQASKLFIPEYGYFATPKDGDAGFWHVGFADGRQGFNVGLIAQLIKRAPLSWAANFAAEYFAASRIAPEDVMPEQETWNYKDGAWVKAN